MKTYRISVPYEQYVEGWQCGTVEYLVEAETEEEALELVKEVDDWDYEDIDLEEFDTEHSEEMRLEYDKAKVIKE